MFVDDRDLTVVLDVRAKPRSVLGVEFCVLTKKLRDDKTKLASTRECAKNYSYFKGFALTPRTPKKSRKSAIIPDYSRKTKKRGKKWRGHFRSTSHVTWRPIHLRSTWKMRTRLCSYTTHFVGIGLVCLPTLRFLSSPLVSSNSMYCLDKYQSN